MLVGSVLKIVESLTITVKRSPILLPPWSPNSILNSELHMMLCSLLCSLALAEYSSSLVLEQQAKCLSTMCSVINFVGWATLSFVWHYLGLLHYFFLVDTHCT